MNCNFHNMPACNSCAFPNKSTFSPLCAIDSWKKHIEIWDDQYIIERINFYKSVSMSSSCFLPYLQAAAKELNRDKIVKYIDKMLLLK